MLKNLVISIFILNSLVSILNCIKCDTPLDCFEKAIEIVEKDRESMKKIVEDFEKTKSEITNKIVDITSQVEILRSDLANSNKIIQEQSVQIAKLTSTQDEDNKKIQLIADEKIPDLYSKHIDNRKMAYAGIPVNDFVVQLRNFNTNKINRCLQHNGYGNTLIMADCNKANSQLFRIETTDDPLNLYKFVVSSDPRYAIRFDYPAASGGRLYLGDNNGQNYTNFRILPSSGNYVITSGYTYGGPMVIDSTDSKNIIFGYHRNDPVLNAFQLFAIELI